MSYHSLLVLYIEKEIVVKGRPFKFFNGMADNEHFIPFIQHEWSKWKPRSMGEISFVIGRLKCNCKNCKGRSLVKPMIKSRVEE